MATLRRAARNGLNALIGFSGFQLVRPGEMPHIISYQPFRRTLREARKAGLAVGDYLDQKFHVPGATQGTIDRMVQLGILSPRVRTVCEIGPGSGRYLEKVARVCTPSTYEIYEPDREWCEWLRRSYRVVARQADGTTLGETPTGSVDLAHAHKVLVYLPFVVTCHYFEEMIRVARKGGWIVFDIVSEACMPEAILEKWIASGVYYPCIMPRDYVIALFARRKCSLRTSFFAPMMPGQSEYLVFVKDE